jgi:hypothetical protein
MNAATPLGAWGCSVLSRYFQFVVSSVTDLTVIAWFCRIIMQPIIPGSNPFVLTNFLLQGLSSATLAALGSTAPSVSVSASSSGPVQSDGHAPIAGCCARRGIGPRKATHTGMVTRVYCSLLPVLVTIRIYDQGVSCCWDVSLYACMVVWYFSFVCHTRYGMVDVCDGYLAAEASGFSFE